MQITTLLYVLASTGTAMAVALNPLVSDDQIDANTNVAAELAFNDLSEGPDKRQTENPDDKLTFCDGRWNLAITEDCRQLVSSLLENSQRVPKKPRHIKHNSCYMSWSQEWEQTRGWYHGGAKAILDRCDNGGSMSGRRVKLHGTPVTVCLSNRPNGCS